MDFEAIETAVRRKALEIAARAVEQKFNAESSDCAGPTIVCSCGGAARYKGRVGKTVTR